MLCALRDGKLEIRRGRTHVQVTLSVKHGKRVLQGCLNVCCGFGTPNAGLIVPKLGQKTPMSEMFSTNVVWTRP